MGKKLFGILLTLCILASALPCASLAAVSAAAVATSVQPVLQNLLGDDSIPFLFLLSGTGGLLNLLLHGRRFGNERAG